MFAKLIARCVFFMKVFFNKSLRIILCKNIYLLLICIFVLNACVAYKSNEIQRKRGYKSFNYGMFTGTKPIIWGTDESNKMITRTMYKKPFFALVSHFAGQLYPVTCGPASARIVLEAIYERTNTPFPVDKEHSLDDVRNGLSYGRFVVSEKNIFDLYHGDDDNYSYDVIARQKRHTCKELKGTFSGGMDANILANVINLHSNAKAEYFEVKAQDNQPKNVDSFRKIVRDVMSSDGKYMIANYHLGAVYPFASGHFSPIVAYDPQTDMVLIMDVAIHLGTWHWVKVEELYRAMNTVVSDIQRGYIIIEEVNDENKSCDEMKKK